MYIATLTRITEIPKSAQDGKNSV